MFSHCQLASQMKMIHMREEVRASICAHANVWHGSNTISTIPFFVACNVIVKLFFLRYSVMFSPTYRLVSPPVAVLSAYINGTALINSSSLCFAIIKSRSCDEYIHWQSNRCLKLTQLQTSLVLVLLSESRRVLFTLTVMQTTGGVAAFTSLRGCPLSKSHDSL